MLRIVRRKPYQAWTLICLVGGLVLAVWGYVEISAVFQIEPGVTGEMLARAEHNRDESALAAALGGFLLCVPTMLVGFVVIWSARRWS
jgi:biotin transporter BioY